MWDFTKSALSFSWAMSLFGAQQMANLFAPSKATKAFDDVTHAAEAELDNTLKAAFRAGDVLQRGLVDLTLSVLTGQILDPRRWTGIAPDVMQQSANTGQQTRQTASGGGWSSPAQSIETASNMGRPSPQPVSQVSRGASAQSQRAVAGWGPVSGSGPAPSPTSGVQPIAEPDISPDFPYESHYVEVFGAKMHYIDEGSGDPIMFVHGNATWSYTWRNIIPYLKPYGRCIAPDLIGLGRSDKPDIEYRWVEHARYLEEFIKKLGLKNITLVLNDFGISLTLNYAMYHEENIKAVAFFEGVFKTFPRWEDFSTPEFRELFKKFRTGGVGGEGWQLLVEQNFFIEQLLPQAAGRQLTEKELNFYREPFKEPRDRIPIWRFTQSTPIEGEPKDVWDAVTEINERLQRSELPKLFFYATPGGLITPQLVDWARGNLKNLRVVHVGPGVHYLQESSPHLLGRELVKWYSGLPSTRRF